MGKRFNVPYNMIPDLSTLSRYELEHLVVPHYLDRYSKLKYEDLKFRCRSFLKTNKSRKTFEERLEYLYTKQRYKVPPTIERFKAIGYRWLIRGLNKHQVYYKLAHQYEIAEYMIDKNLAEFYRRAT